MSVWRGQRLADRVKVGGKTRAPLWRICDANPETGFLIRRELLGPVRLSGADSPVREPPSPWRLPVSCAGSRQLRKIGSRLNAELVSKTRQLGRAILRTTQSQSRTLVRRPRHHRSQIETYPRSGWATRRASGSK